jgi:RNA polymerase sigma factor (TIGR02999 family)
MSSAEDSSDTERRKRLFALIHADLTRRARRLLGEHDTSSLSTDRLVNEAYIKLMQSASEISDQTHLFRIAVSAMRQIIIDHARARLTQKRDGDITALSDEVPEGTQESHALEVLAIDRALLELSKKSERMGQIVELHFFGGLTFEEIAEYLDLSIATVHRDWRIARSELYARLEEAQSR